MADRVADLLGSWTFILCTAGLLLAWVFVNILAYEFRWDPYPFILLNLFLSVAAAVEAPIILMSQNRMEEKDRLRAELDFETNVKAEKEIEEVKRQLIEIKTLLEAKNPGKKKLTSPRPRM
ncbi:MAG: DUF1003 domain-containing protein [Candidatus Doudnabacteria bacterium]|nr:DUF1003 domain-containing protein [Candidatus Doudnabacteria bacterium]